MLTNALLGDVKTTLKNRIINNFLYGAVGTGTTAPTPSDTALESEVLRKPRQQYSEPDPDTVVVSLWIASTEANGNTLSEVGFFDDASAGTLYARQIFTGIAKDNTIELWIDEKITIEVIQE